MSDLISSVPGIMSGLLTLVESAAAAQNPSVSVFPWAIEQYQPGSYVMVTGVENVEYEWETIGVFGVRERYDVTGLVTVFTGASAVDQPTVAIDTLSSTFAVFQSCVMTPVMTHMDVPVLGSTGPQPQIVLPLRSDYSAGPGDIAGSQAGWQGTLEWSFHFEAYLTLS